MTRQRDWICAACVALALGVAGCQTPATTAKPGGIKAKSAAKSDTKNASKPLPRDTIPAAKEVGL
jgi:hypothetical protein